MKQRGDKSQEDLSGIFTIDPGQVDRQPARPPEIVRRKAGRKEAESAPERIEQMGGRIGIQSDESGAEQNRGTGPSKDRKGRFSLCINQIDTEESKHRIASHLNGLLNLDYLVIKNDLLRRTPALVPGQYSYDEAVRIRGDLEELGSKVLIIQAKPENRAPAPGASQIQRASSVLIAGVLVLLSLFFLLMMNRSQDGRENLKTEAMFASRKQEALQENGPEKKADLALAGEAVEALLVLDADYRSGISYQAYVDELENAKSRVESFMDSDEARKRLTLAHSIGNILIHYENVAELWSYKVNNGAAYLSQEADAARSLLRIYPRAARPKENGGARGTTDNQRQVLWIDPLISIMATEASKELKRVSRILGVACPVSGHAS
ncbi:MAG: hypothetical protein JRH07_15310 [Deltaproteobacteria bacterium]|nr:hypothetical protein [Deltaproteobacteria bacterium]